MQFEVELIVVLRLLKLLSAVLLIADDSLQITRREVERVVPYQLIVLHLLEGQLFAVAVARESLFVFQLARLWVALSLDDARRQVIDRSRQP